MSDIAQTLRQWSRDFSTDNDAEVFAAAAAEIERLRADHAGAISDLKSCWDRLDELRNQLVQARGALAWIYNSTEPAAIKHRDYDDLASALCKLAKSALDGEFVDDMRAAEVYDLNKLSHPDETRKI